MFRTVKLFADGANIEDIARQATSTAIDGFTTNPTLMRKAGVEDYKAFALNALRVSRGKPISFEVFADDLPTIEAQALVIHSWGRAVYVKVPVTTTKGEPIYPVLGRLAEAGVKLNITAVFTVRQVLQIVRALPTDAKAIISIFAGRLADSGINPLTAMRVCVPIARPRVGIEVLWASPRQVYDVVLAAEAGCHIITMSKEHLDKLALIGKDPDEYSRETVQMFYNDAKAAGYSIEV